MTRQKSGLLLATSAIMMVMPAMSMADSNNDADVYSEISAQPIDFIARGESIRSMDVVDRQGREIGNISDFIVDFGESELLYVLLAIARGESEAAPDSGNGADDESAGDDEGEAAEGGNGQGASYYPIPLDALRLVALDELRAAEADDEEMAEGDSPSEPAPEQSEEPDQAEETPGAEINEALASMTVNDVVGMSVVTEDDEEISEISDVVALNQEPHFVMAVGGFLGIGETNVAIRAQQFTVDEENGRFVLPLTADQLRDMPDAEYDDEARLPQDMLLSEAFETAGQMPADSGDEAAAEDDAAQDGAATDDEAPAPDDASTGDEAADGETADGDESAQSHPLDGMVLMLSISRDDLANAPSFSEGEFPNVDDASWHQTVVGFYDEMLSESAGNGSSDSLQMNGDSGDEGTEAEPEPEPDSESGDDPESSDQN